MKTILITGAGSGVGRGLSQILARNGHTVVATDLNAGSVVETADLVRKEGGACRGLACDVTDEASVRDIMHTLKGERIDVLVNNAGIQHVAKLEDFPQERWDRVVDVILRGTCLMTRAVLPGMRERGFGRIVLIGSIHSLVASPYKTAYTAAKHALVGFARSVALETADVDITINTICPSYIRTPLVEAQIRDQAKAHGIPEEEVVSKIMLQPMPKRAFITVEEVAATIDFLIGDAARNITAQALAIDGGWTAR